MNPRRRFLFLLIPLLLALSPTAGAKEFVGDYLAHELQENSVVFHCQNADVVVQICTPEMVKIALLPRGNPEEDTSFVVIHRLWPEATFSVRDEGGYLRLETDQLVLLCSKSPFRMSFREPSGRVLLRERSEGGLGWEGPWRFAYFQLEPAEHFYGLGEKGIPLDRRGYAFDTYNRAHYRYESPEATMNINIPFLCSPRGYGLYFDTPYPGYFDLGASDPAAFYYRADGGAMVFYFIYGPSLKEVIQRYTWLTGRQPLPPIWALGYLQSKFGYRSEAEARDVVSTLRQKGIPCDALILDLYWYGTPTDMGNLSWDTSHWPQPEQMIADFRAQGVKVVLIEEPYVTTQSVNYAEAAQKGYFGHDAFGQPIVIPFFWAGAASLLDFTHPEVQSWWWDKHKPLIDQGIAGWWTDLGEPEAHPEIMRHFLGSRDKVHNIFNLLWSKSLFENFRRYRPNDRFFNLTRSGFAGMQRYATFPWSGDVAKTFEGLRVQLPIILGMGLSGVAYQHSDISGFAGWTTPELYARWMAFGAFCPIMRVHSANQSAEPWAFGPQVEAIAKNFIQWRYRLLPYTYTYAYLNHKTGMPLARALVLEFPNDPHVSNLSSEYLWGEHLLVVPVTRAGVTQVEVYLPAGEWVDFWTDRLYAGPQAFEAEAPLERIPLFVRRGAILPLAPVRLHTDDFPPDTLFLHIYPTDSSTAFTLYEDDGHTLDYQRGAFALTTFRVGPDPSGLRLDVGASEGSFTGKPETRLYFATFHLMAYPPDSIALDGQTLTQRETIEELEASHPPGWVYQAGANQVILKWSTPTEQSHEILLWGQNLLVSTSGPPPFPLRFELNQNYPNPFWERTKISFQVNSTAYGRVHLKVYDLLGREVADLTGAITWQGLRGEVSFDGRKLPSGLYLYQLTIGNKRRIRKMIHLR